MKRVLMMNDGLTASGCYALCANVDALNKRLLAQVKMQLNRN